MGREDDRSDAGILRGVRQRPLEFADGLRAKGVEDVRSRQGQPRALIRRRKVVGDVPQAEFGREIDVPHQRRPRDQVKAVAARRRGRRRRRIARRRHGSRVDARRGGGGW